MISKNQVPAYLINELPGIASEFRKIYPSANLFKAMQCLTNYTRRLIFKKDLTTVKRCFVVANNIYVHGNTEVKKVIENIYLYSLASFAYTSQEKTEIKSLLPLCLSIAYRQNVSDDEQNS